LPYVCLKTVAKLDQAAPQDGQDDRTGQNSSFTEPEIRLAAQSHQNELIRYPADAMPRLPHYPDFSKIVLVWRVSSHVNVSKAWAAA
jgi:hypothetical protein